MDIIVNLHIRILEVLTLGKAVGSNQDVYSIINFVGSSPVVFIYKLLPFLIIHVPPLLFIIIVVGAIEFCILIKISPVLFLIQLAVWGKALKNLSEIPC